MKNTLSFGFQASFNFQFISLLFRVCPSFVFGVIGSGNDILIFSNSFQFAFLVSIIKRHFNIYMPIDLTAVDYPHRFSRFSLLGLFRSFLPSTRVFLPSNSTLIICTILHESLSVPSTSHNFPALDWPEREVWDMFGVFFGNHSDLRRLLSDYGFQGHPFRKDFPLSGFSEVRYDDSLQRVVCEPLELTQEYRNFDFLSPWVPVS